ncbi:hypothetical protein, partial [Mesorhizobium sp. dw_380]|uniref:hypothetical protein n=1 Tax=Mesorhizobium sp. dw_380 TaxID=2812001 RepID=UPI001BDF6D03
NFLRQKFRARFIDSQLPQGNRDNVGGRPRRSPIAAALPFDTKANKEAMAQPCMALFQEPRN